MCFLGSVRAPHNAFRPLILPFSISAILLKRALVMTVDGFGEGINIFEAVF